MQDKTEQRMDESSVHGDCITAAERSLLQVYGCLDQQDQSHLWRLANALAQCPTAKVRPVDDDNIGTSLLQHDPKGW